MIKKQFWRKLNRMVELYNMHHKISKMINKQFQQRSKKNGKALKFASEKLKNNKEVVLLAVKQQNCGLKYVSEKLKDDK